MALFSRRPSGARSGSSEEVPEAVDATTDADAAADPAASAPAQTADAVDDDDFDGVVGITLSAFQGLGAASSAPVPEPGADPSGEPARSEPARSEPTAATVHHNAPLAAALASLPESPDPAQLLQVARQVLQGQLFLRVKGDAKKLLADRANIPLAITTIGEDQYVLAYSGVTALRASLAADGASDTSAMAQPAQAVLNFLLGGTYAGLIIDPASAPARAVLPRDLIAQMMQQADPEFRVKKLLAGRRTETTPAEIVAVMPSVNLWVAVNKPEGSDEVGVAEARTADGDRLIEVFSHPIEVAALGRGDRPAQVTGAQLGAALRSDPGLAGVLIDPAGPWIRLDRAQLAPLLVEAP